MGQPTIPTIKRLFAVSGNRCAFPDCDVQLVEEVSGTVIGRICHICAQRAGGPRYDASQSEAERHAFENLILMCPVHHDIIDADINIYSVRRLRNMKMRHESSSLTRTTAVNAADEIASKLLASVGPTNGSLVTSINQSGGQTAQAITNIHRHVVLDKSYFSEQLILDTFAIDPAQCAYEEHRLDASRPFWPDEADPITVCYIPGGKVRRYGKEFSSRAEAEEYGATLRQKFNHYSFYEGAPHTMFLERSHEPTSGNSPNYPVFYVSLSNHTKSHVVLSALYGTVLQSQPLVAIGESHALLPLVAYKVAIEPREGVYRTPAVPSLKIESGDAAAFHVVLEPRVRMMGGYYWFITLRFDCGRQYVATDVFAIVM